MKVLLRNLASFILPILAAIVIPALIEKDIEIKNIFSFIAGFVVIIIGLIILVICNRSFILVGQGTLAPWSPTKIFVIQGLYRYTRNPMITGVLMILLGESLAILSLNILIWAVIFFIVNTFHMIFYEEPDLERKFGDQYRSYRKEVHRWIPRLSPYNVHVKSKDKLS